MCNRPSLLMYRIAFGKYMYHTLFTQKQSILFNRIFSLCNFISYQCEQDLQDDMADMFEIANEVQDTLGRSYGMPDDIDEADLDAGWLDKNITVLKRKLSKIFRKKYIIKMYKNPKPICLVYYFLQVLKDILKYESNNKR